MVHMYNVNSKYTSIKLRHQTWLLGSPADYRMDLRFVRRQLLLTVFSMVFSRLCFTKYNVKIRKPDFRSRSVLSLTA